MKKFLTILMMITCVFGLTACGSEEEVLSETQANKLSYAEQISVQSIIPTMEQVSQDAARDEFLNNYNDEELSFIFENQGGISSEGTAISGGITSFNSSLKITGAITNIGTPVSEADGDEIIVRVPVTGEKGNAEVELIFTNDMFCRLISCSMNTEYSMGELMGRAGLNTLLGMGTVFAVLILISLIIGLFVYIPKIQDAFTKKTKVQESKEAEAAPAPVVETAAVTESPELADDLELVAVISAAIAASQGATSTDGLVVRSIKRAGKGRWQRA